MKQRDYKTADAPKTEPLKASLGDRLRNARAVRFNLDIGSAPSVVIDGGVYDVKQVIADIDAALVANDEKEQTP